MVLETERLLLREMRWSDFDALHRVWGDPETMVHYPSAYSEDLTRTLLAKNISRYRNDGFGLWAMSLRVGSEEVIGDCGITLQPVEHETLPEVGYHLHHGYWGQGLATEAARACLEYAQSVLGFRRVVAIIRDVNLPSRRVAERLGMAPWKEIERTGFPHVVYSISF